MKIGRNDPCPCGSGKKFKLCCIEKIIPFPGSEDREFATLEEARSFAESRIEAYNNAPLADFLGLSPNTLQAIGGRAPGDLRAYCTLPAKITVDDVPAIPVLHLVRELFRQFPEAWPDGLPLTTSGSLKSPLVTRLYRDCVSPHALAPKQSTKIYQEHVPELDRLKHALDLCGLTYQDDKTLWLSRRATELYRAAEWPVLYRKLFFAFSDHLRLDWPGERSDSFVQSNLLFCLHLLESVAGETWTAGDELGAVLHKAFPHSFQNTVQAANRYAEFFLERFAYPLGLAARQRDPLNRDGFPRADRWRLSPLYRRILRLQLKTPRPASALEPAPLPATPVRHPVRDQTAGLQLRITLLRAARPLWRTFIVPIDLPLADLHRVIQTVMGWDNRHDWMFRDDIHAVFPGTTREIREFQKENPNAIFAHPDMTPAGLCFWEKGVVMRYIYDFGDNWEHELTLLDIDPDTAEVEMFTCIDGAGACPPEDCGGINRYNDLVDDLPASIRKGELPPHFAPDAFDRKAVTSRLERKYFGCPPHDEETMY